MAETQPVYDNARDAPAEPTEPSRTPGTPEADRASSWWQSPLGQLVREREQRFFDEQLPDLFGLYALQVGRAGGSVLAASRIRSQWVVDLEPDVDVVAQCDRLPFAENQFDLIALPHTLEADPWPHEVLREVHRVLRPEGQLLLTGFNPLSLFGLRRHLGRRDCTPWTHNFISLPRAKDWLTLLGFDLAIVSLTCFGLPVTQQRRLERFARIERWGEAYWPFLGGVYCIRAIKRVAGMRVIRPAWHGSRTRAATVSSATRPVPRQGNGHG